LFFFGFVLFLFLFFFRKATEFCCNARPWAQGPTQQQNPASSSNLARIGPNTDSALCLLQLQTKVPMSYCYTWQEQIKASKLRSELSRREQHYVILYNLAGNLGPV
jgi:hypothetical protein